MIKKIVYFSIISILCTALFFSARYALAQYQVYQNLVEEISLVPLEEKDVPGINTIYANEAPKYNNIELPNFSYYGYEYMYERDDILFFSATPACDEEKLAEIADELHANTHGEEIAYLDKVIVFSGSDGIAAGSHSSSYYSYELPISFHAFLPEDTEFTAVYEKSTINIYGISSDTTIEDLSLVLSHEYGHHYTNYHFGLNGNVDDTSSEYYRLRAEGNDKIIVERKYYEDYLEDHMWYLSEIAAEDYVYLMGSETATRVVRFYDSFQKFEMYKNGYLTRLRLNQDNVVPCINAMPHENIHIPLPSAVDNLADYYYSFIDEESPFVTEVVPINTLNLRLEMAWSIRYTFFWDQPYTDPEVTYTLICYDLDDNIRVVVKTTRGDQPGTAGLGDYQGWPSPYPYNQNHLYNYDFETGEILRFRVSITFPDGTILLSDPVEFEMGR